MRILKTLYQISKLTRSNFKQEVYRFLRAYRATPHCTTKIAQADLMYPSRKFRTRLPIGVSPREHDFEELYQRALEKKMQMKGYADNKRYVHDETHRGLTGSTSKECGVFYPVFLSYFYLTPDGEQTPRR